MVILLIHKYLLPLMIFIAVLLLLGCGDSKKIDDPEFWQTATADDMKSVMDDWRDSESRDGDFTPLHYAVLNEAKPELVLALLDYGADANARYDNQFSDFDGWTPLHLSTSTPGNDVWVVEVTELLLNRGADVEVRDAEGATPLHLAAFYGAASTVEALLKRGADINARAGGEEFDHSNYYLGTPLHLAVREPEGLLNSLDEVRNDTPTWYVRFREFKTTIVETLLAHGARTDLEDELGSTPLH